MRLLIDGMNVIGSRPDGWWRDRPGAMRRLVAALEELASASGDEIAVVFDGRPLDQLPRGTVDVGFASGPRRGAADDEIAQRVADDPDPASLIVITSDRGLADRVRAHGARVEGARTLIGRLAEQAAGG